MFKIKKREQELADTELHFTILEIIGMSYTSFMNPTVSLSLTYFDKNGAMESVFCEFDDVKKFELLEDKMTNEFEKLLQTEFALVDENIPAFFVSSESNYLNSYIAHNTLENDALTKAYKHFIFYGNTGGIAHIVTPKAPKLSEL